MRHTDITFIDI